MNSAVIAAVISAVATILVTVITVISTNARTRADITTKLALQDERQVTLNRKIEDLSQEVKAHNEYGRSIPVLQEQIKTLYHRVEELERRDAS